MGTVMFKLYGADDYKQKQTQQIYKSQYNITKPQE